jgi:hypothetical protein
MQKGAIRTIALHLLQAAFGKGVPIIPSGSLCTLFIEMLTLDIMLYKQVSINSSVKSVDAWTTTTICCGVPVLTLLLQESGDCQPWQ